MGRPRETAEQSTSTLYRGADGYWHAHVTMGRAPDGSTARRHVQGRSKTEPRDAVRELEHRRDTLGYTWIRHGDPTLGDWLEHWLDAVLPMTVRWKTLSTYRSQMRLHVVPALGGWRMSEIQPEHLEEHYRRMGGRGLLLVDPDQGVQAQHRAAPAPRGGVALSPRRREPSTARGR